MSRFKSKPRRDFCHADLSRNIVTDMLDRSRTRSSRPLLFSRLSARVLRHDAQLGLTTLFFEDGELRVPLIDVPEQASVTIRIDASDVSIALSRPMDVSITNRLPGKITEISFLDPPYVRARFELGKTRLDALVTRESVERLALVPGLEAWVMIKAVAISRRAFKLDPAPTPRPWPSDRKSSRAKS
jgi:molybdate transport system ATP-binding protein